VTDALNLGPYTVRCLVRPDNPAWPQYAVFLGEVKIGACFSIPDLGACQWLEAQQREQTLYAYSAAPLPELTKRRELTNKFGVNQHNRKLGAPRKPETLLDIEKALAGG